jgi:hypothetical protein
LAFAIAAPALSLGIGLTLLVSATALRVAGAGLTSQPRATLIALSGLLAWVGLVAFAAGLLRAALSQQRRKTVAAAPSA